MIILIKYNCVITVIKGGAFGEKRFVAEIFIGER